MNIADIIALAKAGYKFSEVKELMSLENQSEDKTAQGDKKDPEQEKKEQPEKTEQHEAGKEQPDKVQQNGTVTPEDADAILSYKNKIEELTEQIKKLQSDNVHTDLSDKENEKKDEDLLDDITRSFM